MCNLVLRHSLLLFSSLFPVEQPPSGIGHRVIMLLLLLLLLFPHISPISRTRGHRRRLPFPYHRYIQKNTNKRREREEKNNRRENLPRSDRRGRGKICMVAFRAGNQYAECKKRKQQRQHSLDMYRYTHTYTCTFHFYLDSFNCIRLTKHY